MASNCSCKRFKYELGTMFYVKNLSSLKYKFMKKTKEEMVGLFLKINEVTTAQGGVEDKLRKLKGYQFLSKFLFKRELKKINKKLDEYYGR